MNDLPTLPVFLQHVVSLHGDRLLVKGDGRSLTYADVEAESANLALGLLAAGVGKGTRLGLLMPNGPDWIIAWLAGLRIGALVVGVSTFLAPRELGWLLRFADIDTLLVRDRFLKHDYLAAMETVLPSLTDQSGRETLMVPDAPYLRQVWRWGSDTRSWLRGSGDDLIGLGQGRDELNQDFLKAVEQQVMPSDLGVVIFTSGSTAQPKGVVHTHGSMVRQSYEWSKYSYLSADEKLGVMMPLFWIGGMLTCLLDAMVSGGAVLFPDTPDPAAVLKMIRTERPDYLNGWLGQFQALMDHPDFRPEDFARLKPIHGAQARGGLFGTPNDTPVELNANALGMSESFGAHSGELAGVFLKAEDAGSCGRAIGGMERKVLDPDGDAELPPGELGELAIRGGSLMDGYYKRERSEVFEPDGFFRTGDRGILREDGHLFFGGRLTDMIKTSGANVSAAEVEQVMSGFPELGEVAVLGMPDRKLGEAVVAVVVTKPEVSVSEEDLRARLRAELSSYKVPKRIYQLPYDRVPRTDSGKIRKHKLLEVLSAEEA